MRGHICFDHDGTICDMDRVATLPGILYPGIRELILELHKNNFGLYVWTMRPAPNVIENLKKLEIIHLFSDFACAGVIAPKPNPEGLENMLGNFDKKKCLHIGDNMADVVGAKRFGIGSIGAAWDDPSKISMFKEVKADFTSKNPLDCLEYILNNY